MKAISMICIVLFIASMLSVGVNAGYYSSENQNCCNSDDGLKAVRHSRMNGCWRQVSDNAKWSYQTQSCCNDDSWMQINRYKKVNGCWQEIGKENDAGNSCCGNSEGFETTRYSKVHGCWRQA